MGWGKDDNGISLYVVPTEKSISKPDYRNLFTIFKSLKDDYEYFIKNSDLTKSKSPFIQWILQDQNVVLDIQKRFADDPQLQLNESSWNVFCCLQSQYSVGWPAPGKEPSK